MADSRSSAELTEYRLELLEKAVTEIGEALKGIQNTLNQLANLEVRHTETRAALERAFAAISTLDNRVKAVEQVLPVLKLTSGWVRTGVIALVGIVFLAVVKLVIIN